MTMIDDKIRKITSKSNFLGCLSKKVNKWKHFKTFEASMSDACIIDGAALMQMSTKKLVIKY